ncbi:hypothetical protein ACHAXM_006944 [Skeletonema potamos]
MDDEFIIRVTGGPPPPLPGKKGGGGGKIAALAQQQKRYNLRLLPSTPLDQFRKDVFALFNIPSNSTHLYQVSFLGGFPPKELDQSGIRTVHELGVRANESVIVKFTLNESTENESTTVSKASAKQSASPSPVGRQKRAAASAAAASFPELIAAQDAMMKTEQKKKSSSGKGFGSTNKRIVATTTSSSPNHGKKAKKAKIEGTGYRLSDGKAVEGAVSKRKTSTTKQQNPMFKSEDDIAGKLLSSMGGGGGGNVGKFLRMAMKGAVEKSYEESRAAVRVSAVNQGAFNFEKVKGGTVVEGKGVVLGTAKDHDQSEGGDHDDDEALGRTLYMVSYSKGLEGRGRYEEQVEIISQDALKGLIEHVYNTKPEGGGDGDDSDDKNSDGKEMLRPVSMAQLSPRVFWSLVYHYNKAEKYDSSASVTVEAMLQSMMPYLDWSHLERGGRKRILSEKARENLRQEKKSSLPIIASETDEDGVKAIEEMEESILEAIMPSNDLVDGKELGERERRARAAIARFSDKGETEPKSSPPAEEREDVVIDDWKLVTPPEDDIDELIECIMEGKESESYDEKDAKGWAAALLDNVRNWRGLANADTEIVFAQIDNHDNLQADTVERWIEVAQQRSIEEIMLEILDGDQDAHDCLMNKAHSSTPKDLSFWYVSPGMLIDILSKGDNEVKSTWNESDVKRWASRANIALSTLPWLDLYLTPV